jgi:hypothetical protein
MEKDEVSTTVCMTAPPTAATVSVVVVQVDVDASTVQGPVTVPVTATADDEPVWRCVLLGLCNAVLMVVAVLLGVVVGSMLVVVAVPWAIGLAGQLLCAGACCCGDDDPNHAQLRVPR